MSNAQQVILVDANDKEIGQAPKMFAHEKGLLHRAFSIFVLRETNQWEVLLQQRAEGKYHSAGLWSNTCCSHPSPGEDMAIGAQRRIYEEMGIAVDLHHIGQMTYHVRLENGLIEHEYDHIFVGVLSNPFRININPLEVKASRWMTIKEIEKALTKHPEQFTAWFKPAFDILGVYIRDEI